MSLRLFLAIPVPPTIATRLSALETNVPGASWRQAEHYHLTLCFVGEVDEATARDIDLELGRIVADKVNAYRSPVTVLLPTKAISIISAEGGAFYDPAADAAGRQSASASANDGSVRGIAKGDRMARPYRGLSEVGRKDAGFKGRSSNKVTMNSHSQPVPANATKLTGVRNGPRAARMSSEEFST